MLNYGGNPDLKVSMSPLYYLKTSSVLNAVLVRIHVCQPCDKNRNRPARVGASASPNQNQLSVAETARRSLWGRLTSLRMNWTKRSDSIMDAALEDIMWPDQCCVGCFVEWFCLFFVSAAAKASHDQMLISLAFPVCRSNYSMQLWPPGGSTMQFLQVTTAWIQVHLQTKCHLQQKLKKKATKKSTKQSEKMWENFGLF